MKIKPIRQRDASGCGPACIEMVLNYFDIPHTVSKISSVTKYKKGGGLYNTQLIEALKAFGLKTKVHKNTSWDDLATYNRDHVVIVLSWMLAGYVGHLSVLEKIDDKHIYLAEPTQGKIVRIEKIKFLRLWLDYEATGIGKWYPEKKSDIQLRWMVIVSK